MAMSQLSVVSTMWETQNLKLAIILPTEYGIFVLKTNSGLQQHIYQEQSILRQISNLEH